MALKEKLKFFRKRLNWTITYTAIQAGLSASILHALEQGRLKNPELKTLWKLSDLFACPIDYLIDREVPNVVPEPCPLGKNCHDHRQNRMRWWENVEITYKASKMTVDEGMSKPTP